MQHYKLFYLRYPMREDIYFRSLGHTKLICCFSGATYPEFSKIKITSGLSAVNVNQTQSQPSEQRYQQDTQIHNDCNSVLYCNTKICGDQWIGRDVGRQGKREKGYFWENKVNDIHSIFIFFCLPTYPIFCLVRPRNNLVWPKYPQKFCVFFYRANSTSLAFP